MKKLLLIALIVALGAYWGSRIINNLDNFVRQQIISHGSQALGVAVGVDKVSLKLLDGKGSVTGLRIDNPAGFSQQPLMQLEQITLDIDLASLQQPPLVIEQLKLGQMKVNYEVNADGQGNINQLYQHLKQQLPSGAAPADDEGQSDAPLLAIRQIRIEPVSLQLDLSALGKQRYPLTLPAFTISDIGLPAGLPPKQLAQAVGKALLEQLTEQIRRQQEKRLREKARQLLKEKEKQLKEKARQKLEKEQQRLKEKLKNKLGSLLDKDNG